MCKVVLISYHSNLNKLYPKKWVDEFRNSILNQTFTDFSIMELNYGGGAERIFENSNYESIQLPTFIHAMNYLIEKALKDGADVVCNSNCDDVFSSTWLQVQLPYIEQGYDIVSCNFSLFRDEKVYHNHYFDKLDLKTEFSKNHNPVAHPAVCYSRKFLEANRYDPGLIPLEDFILWKNTIDNFRFKIVSENLLLHRVHGNSVCQSNNR